MKADEYYAKYKKGLTALYTMRAVINAQSEEEKAAYPADNVRLKEAFDQMNESGQTMLREMLGELSTIRKERHATTTKAMRSIIKEMNDRWNKVNRLLREEYGESPLKDDGVIIASIAIEPRIQTLFPNVKVEE